MLKKIKKALFKKENIPVLFILLLAAFFRIYRIDEYLTFLGDEGRDVLVVKHILDGIGALFQGNLSSASENLTLLGPTASVGGFFLGPIYYYMMAPALFVANFNPVGPAVMVALFGVATVFLVYFVSRKFFDSYLAALAVSLLYAISPLVILYSRSSWNPNPVPFFSLLMLYLLYRAILNKSWKLFAISGVLFGILLQLHYLATFLGVIVALYVGIATFFQFKKIPQSLASLLKRYIFFGVGIIIGWSPFLAFEVRHGFQNFKSIYDFVFQSGETGGNGEYIEIVRDVFFRLFGRLLYVFPQPNDLHLYSSNIVLTWTVIVYATAIVSVGFCLAKLYTSARKKDEAFYKYLLLAVWLATGVFLFGFYKKSIYDYYLGFMYPLPFLLFAAPLSVLFKKGKILLVIGIIIVTLIAILNFYFNPFRKIGNYQMYQVKTISEFVLDQTNGKPYNFAVISGGNSDFAYRYFFETHHMPPVTIEFPGADPERKSITDQLLIVCESNPCHPLGYPLWEVAGFGQAEIVGEWPVSVLRVYKLKHYKGEKPKN